jgi:heptosyltransferase I
VQLPDPIGRVTIAQMNAQLKRADVLVRPDSGPVRMATAAGTLVIRLCAVTNPERGGRFLRRQWYVNRFEGAAQWFFGRTANEPDRTTNNEKPGVVGVIQPSDAIRKPDQVLIQRSENWASCLWRALAGFVAARAAPLKSGAEP